MFFEEFDQYIRIENNFDLSSRKIYVGNHEIVLYFTTCLVDSHQIIEIISNMLKCEKIKLDFEDFLNLVAHQEVKIIEKDLKTVANEVLIGQIVVFFEDKPISIDVKKYPVRAPSESDTEKVIRGSHDGFIESLNTNVALIRRRINDNNLITDMYKIGQRSKTNVCLLYIDDLADKKTINNVKDKIKDINVNHLVMGDKEIEELLVKQRFNPYPLVRYTERPDIVAVHLLQGMFAIIVDNSSSVILAPATLLDHMQHTEEYRQAPILGTYLRIIRFIGVFGSIFLTPLWLILYNNNLLNGFFAFLNPKEAIINIFLQVLIAEIGVEFLRMASIHTPSALSTAMGLIAGILIGDIAVHIGIFSEVTILIVAISAIGTYITPSYELGLANKLMKIIIIILIWVSNYIGFCIGIIFLLIILMTSNSFGKSYLYPLIPFDIKKILRIIIRFPYKSKKE